VRNKMKLTKNILREIIEEIIKEVADVKEAFGWQTRAKKETKPTSTTPKEEKWEEGELEALAAALPAIRKISPIAANQAERKIKAAGRADLLADF